MKKSKKINHLIRTTCLVGALFCYSAVGYAAVMSNTALPTGGALVAGSASGFAGAVTDSNGKPTNIMNITGVDNAIIKWDSFNIGSVATVNFSGKDNFNVLNYVASGGSMSQIHGTMNALNNGNVYLVNPAGVFIGKSAQIDVGSLYVSNKKIQELDDWNGNKLDKSGDEAKTYINTLWSANDADQPPKPAELMSLGHINATSVTFKGDRIVLDTAYVTKAADTAIGADNINIYSNDENNVVLGFEAYDETLDAQNNAIGYKAKDKNFSDDTTGIDFGEKLANVNDKRFTKADGYMWIEDVEQLQAMNTNLEGNYALRNGIDATNTAEAGNSFVSVGSDGSAFKGKLDGLGGRVEGVDFSIFDLHVGSNTAGDNQGLFGVTDGATLKNLTFVSGSATGTENVGMLVGSAMNTKIENVTNSANVSGTNNVGGIVGKLDGGSISGLDAANPLLNTGAVTGTTNVGGIVGKLDAGTLTDARNIGQINGNGDGSYNIGGIAGSITNGATLSGVTNTLNVSGGHDVGGIVGSMVDSKVESATNSGDVTATGYVTDDYYFHTADNKQNPSNGIATKKVYVANVGGIVGSVSGKATLDSVTNDGGNVQSSLVNAQADYYKAGNVGGIVGRAAGSGDEAIVVIKNAVNKENTVYGAHNVGGIAGYLENGTVSGATNNGGDIMGTGARYYNDFVKESVRSNGSESFIIGNMGGTVGYMYGDNAYIDQAGNRGSVHSQFIANSNNIPESAKAANVGGIVGKVDRSKQSTVEAVKDWVEKPNDTANQNNKPAVNDSYNTGDIQGYTGVGGVAGFMYNGEVVGSYNLGAIQSTRASATSGTNVIDALNMGGVVGDTTEGTDARVVLYNVYNSGVIGDADYNYFGRHVGGVIGRLSGTVEKAYNTGAIYNGYNVVGGVAGYMVAGNIKNSFNTGNITVVNQNDAESQVGGIVGTVDVLSGDVEIENVYNLGTIRSFRPDIKTNEDQEFTNRNVIGGLVGQVVHWNRGNNKPNTLTINNAYTLGNIYAGVSNDNGKTYYADTMGTYAAYVGASYGAKGANSPDVSVQSTTYIEPELNEFTNLANNSSNNYYKLNDATSIGFARRTNTDEGGNYKNYYTGFTFSADNGSTGNDIDNTAPWRIYAGSTTPILNAFLPKAEDYFGDGTDADGKPIDHSSNRENISSLQYGTAYNPLLTIIKADNSNGKATIELDWGKMEATKGASFAVYDGSLTINNFENNGDYFGGTLYADGVLTVKNVDVKDADEAVTSTGGDIMLGSGSKLYGSSVTVESKGELIGYGGVQSTGKSDSADITLSGDAGVEIIGAVKSAANGESVTVDGIDGSSKVDDDDTAKELSGQITSNLTDPNKAMPDVADYYGKIVTSSASGNVEIKSTDGDVEVLFGVAQSGYVDAAGSLSFTGSSVYVDSDVKFGDELTFTADETVLDITNIGKVQVTQQDKNSKNTAVNYLHNFLAQGNKLSFSEGSDAIIAVDMWSDDNKYAGKKYDLDTTNTFNAALHSGNFARHTDKVHVWLDDAEQLQGINDYYEEQKNQGNKSGILTYNFALKNDIDANSLQGFHGIGYGLGDGQGTTTDDVNVAFSGNLDGRGYSIIGLNASAGNADSNFDYVGLFSRIGKVDTGEVDAAGNTIYKYGSVKDLNIISSTFTGSSVGAVAGRNEGTIDGVTTFGNRVKSDGSVLTDVFDTGRHQVGAAGGITGINQGTIENVTASDAVIAGIAGQSSDTGGYVDSTAGGIAGINVMLANEDDKKALIEGSAANSAVTSSAGNANALGGVVGINYGNSAMVDVVESLGIVNGSYKSADGSIKATENIGGIAGVIYNGASISNAYNEAHVSGSNAVGGIVGYSGIDKKTVNANTLNAIDNSVNAGIVISSSTGVYDKNNKPLEATRNTGGIVGNSQHSDISNARNTGAISGETNVGGMVGTNAENSRLENVTNDGSATIYGKTNVGGIAGVNEGAINADEQGLTNKGTIHGNNTVGGIAGLNTETGSIVNTNSDITLYAIGNDAKYFGGVAGRNEGTITDATNSGNVLADDADYVGGITGVNGKKLDAGNDPTHAGFAAEQAQITGAHNSNSGTVTGANHVGGVVGLNVGKIVGTEADPATVRNDGYVHATAGGAGGIIGENWANMTNVKLVNGGIVYGEGEGGTGGVIGNNGGSITESDVIGEVGAVVIGKKEVGGLIGINQNNVQGGRDIEENGGNYYAHQVYNNGTVVGGEYKEALNNTDNENEWTQVDANDVSKGYYKVSADSSNIGGVVGTNSSNLSAAYNTGTVVGGTNVGGVVGNNSTMVQQVFNAGTVEGNGDNTVVGKGGGVYDAYDMQTGAVGAISDDANIWKTYGDGNEYGTNKLLKVFLTKLTFNPVKDFDYSLIYNAKEQGFEVQKEPDGTFGVYTVGRENKVKVGTLTSAAGAHSLKDYENSSSLLATNSKTAVGQDYALFNTQQIAASTDNPNNLGFDFGTFNIDTVNLVITLDAVERTYGDDTLTNKNTSTADDHAFIDDGGSDNNKYGFVINVADSGVIKGELNAGMLKELLGTDSANAILSAGSVDKANDGAVAGTSGDIKTNNAGTYEWSTSFAVTQNSGYKLVKNETDAAGNVTTTLVNSLTANDVKGESVVKKADLVINIKDATTTYGTAFKENEYGYTFGAGGSNGLVNGDNQAEIKEIVDNAAGGYDNSAAISDASNPNRVTADADTYTDVVSFVNDKQDIDNALGNYNVITVNKGDAIVDKATLNVTLKDVTHVYGTPNMNGYGYESVEGLTNGDEELESQLKAEMVSDAALKDNNTHTQNVKEESYGWSASVSGIDNISTNYNISYEGGRSYVTPAELTVTLKDVTHVYGTPNMNGYGYESVEGLTNGDEELEGQLKAEMVSDAALKDNNTHTQNVKEGSYGWSASVSGIDNISTNYNISYEGGKSYVTPAELTVTLSDVTHVYGTPNMNDYGYESVEGLTNGDEELEGQLKAEMVSDAALKDNNAHTQNVKEGSYGWSASVSGIDNISTNYNISYEGGKSYVTPAELTVTLNDVTHVYGTPNMSDYGYESVEGLTNGDEELEGQLKAEMVSDAALKDNNTHTQNVKEGSYGWSASVSGIDNISTNYNISYGGGKSYVTPAELTVTLSDVTREYGNTSIINGSYGIDSATLVNGDIANRWTINESQIADGGLTEVEGEIRTNNAGNHTWTVSAENITAEGVDNLHNNYDITVNAGNSIVQQKQLTLNDVFTQIIYGQQNIDWKVLASDSAQESLQGVVYGDDVTVSLGKVTASGGYAVNKGNRDTADAGKYAGSLSISNIALAGDKAGNYSIQDTASGTINVLKAALSVTVDDKEIVAGETPSYTGSIISDLVNGDSETSLGLGAYDLDSSSNAAVIGTYNDQIGVLIGGKVYLNGTHSDMLKNYTVYIDAGTLTVNPVPYGPDPQNPDWWDAEDKYPWYQWDKQRNARERKAEVHFVDGGMAIH